MSYIVNENGINREATVDETANIDALKAVFEAQLKTQNIKKLTRQSVLDKLGLTADEAAALLG